MKKKVTISISDDLLKSVDALIDNKTVRNRSNAIENLLHKTLGFAVQKGVILAGGRKNSKPVSIRQIAGRPLLQMQLDYLKLYGICNVLICAGRFTDELQKKFGDGSQFGMCLEYSREEKPLGTAGAVLNAKKLIGNQRFLVLHADVLTEFNLADLIKFHAGEDAKFTIAVKPRLAERKFGKVIIVGNKIVEFIQDEGDRGTSIVNAGVYLFEPEIFDYIPKDKPSYFERDVFPQLAKKRELSAYIFQGKWYEVSRYKDYLIAKKEWENSV